MTFLLAVAGALAAPVVAGTPMSALDRCAVEAETQAGVAPGSWRDGLPATLPRTDRLAIVVGVPCYRAEGIPSLAYSTRDAEQMAATLERAGFTVVRLFTVVDRATLAAALDRAGAAVDPGGTLLVYFSGHGILRDEGGSLVRYLVLSDTDPTAVSGTGMSVLDLDRRVARVDVDARIVIHDTCFAADRAGGKSISAPGLTSEHAKGLSMPEANLALQSGDLRLYASQFFEQAIESPEHRSSVYTFHLLSALSLPAADLDGDGCVGLLEAHEWARDATVRERDGFQTPQIRDVEAGNLTLGCRAHAPTRAVLVPPPETFGVSLVDREGAVSARDGGAVEAGRYRLEVERVAPGTTGEVERTLLVRTPVHLAAGDWLDVRNEIGLRRALTTVEFAVGWSPGFRELYPAMSFGGSVHHLWRDRGAGRPMIGARVGGLPGPGAPPVDVRFTAGEGLVDLGWQWTLPLDGPNAHVSVGPLLAGGGAFRPASGSSDVKTVWPWLLDPMFRMHLAAGPAGHMLFSIEAGGRFVGGGDPGSRGPIVSGSPALRFGVGGRL